MTIASYAVKYTPVSAMLEENEGLQLLCRYELATYIATRTKLIITLLCALVENHQLQVTICSYTIYKANNNLVITIVF